MWPNDRSDWCFDDPAPGVPLSDIEPISKRSEALVTRSESPLLSTHFLQIFGAVSMLAGLDYHFQNFEGAIQRLPPVFSGPYFSPVRHEAIAWINRVGQYYYFCRSPLVAKHTAGISISTIESVLPFRNKHAAHRSIDKPWSGDTPHHQTAQALSLSELGGQLWTPRPGVARQPESFQLNTTHYVAFYMRGLGDSDMKLVIQRDHRQIMMEGYVVLEALLSHAHGDLQPINREDVTRAVPL